MALVTKDPKTADSIKKAIPVKKTTPRIVTGVSRYPTTARALVGVNELLMKHCTSFRYNNDSNMLSFNLGGGRTLSVQLEGFPYRDQFKTRDDAIAFLHHALRKGGTERISSIWMNNTELMNDQRLIEGMSGTSRSGIPISNAARLALTLEYYTSPTAMDFYKTKGNRDRVQKAYTALIPPRERPVRGIGSRRHEYYLAAHYVQTKKKYKKSNGLLKRS